MTLINRFRTLVDELAVLSEDERFDIIGSVRDMLHHASPNASEPVDYVRWVPMDTVEANDYNPNSVARQEMGLLLRSIEADGFTQPVVVIWDDVRQKYVVVDGFHRQYTMKVTPWLAERCHNRVPVVVIEKDINNRMASTVRHNRARGKHSVDGMANMIFGLLENGWSDEAICNEIGLETEELLRLKHITGFSKLFANQEYSKAWLTRSQIRARFAADEREKKGRAAWERASGGSSDQADGA